MHSAGTANSDGFAGLVLAGGASRRMGRDKALLSLHGETLLARAVRLLETAGADPVLVSGTRPGGIPDRRPGLGPAGGLASAIAARPDMIGRLLLIVPIDMPGLTAATLRRLATGARETGGARFPRGPLPLALRITPVLAARLAQPETGQRGLSLHTVCQMAAVRQISPPRSGIELENANTPAEWRTLLESIEP